MPIHLYIFETNCPIRREDRIRAAVRSFTHDSQGSLTESLQICRTNKGRPYLARNGKTAEEDPSVPEISITDSGSCWIVAVSDQRIGIDLQENRIRRQSCPTDDAERCRRLTSRYFHVSESSFILSAQTDEETIRRFFQVWTAKEAYVKYTGTGIDGNFSSFAVNTGTTNASRDPDHPFFYLNPELDCAFLYPRTDSSRTLCVCIGCSCRIPGSVPPADCRLYYYDLKQKGFLLYD